MLEDPSQGAGANHEQDVEATALVLGEDSSKPEEIVVSQAKKLCVLRMGNGLGRTLRLVLRTAIPFYDPGCPLGPSQCALALSWCATFS